VFLKVVIEIISSNLFTPKKVEGKRGGINNLNEENKIGYYAVIPATILFNKDLKANEKLLYAIITILSNKEGYCFASNAYLSNLLGAEIYEVTKGEGTLKEAVDEAFEYLLKNKDVFYLIGSAVGPSPYPEMVKYFQKIIGKEAKKQILEQEKQLPKVIIACIGGGSNSIGLFTEFVKDKNVDIFGVEGAGKGLETGRHASAIYNNKVGILHGMKTYTMQDNKGNIQDAYSISAGLDYPGIGPEHAYLKSIGRVKYDSITDNEAVNAFKLLCKLEGIIPALESSHAIAYAIKIAKNYKENDSIIVNLSGRGDKDMGTILKQSYS